MRRAQAAKVFIGQLSKLGMIYAASCGQHHPRSFVVSCYIVEQVRPTDRLDVFGWTEDCSTQRRTLHHRSIYK